MPSSVGTGGCREHTGKNSFIQQIIDIGGVHCRHAPCTACFATEERRMASSPRRGNATLFLQILSSPSAEGSSSTPDASTAVQVVEQANASGQVEKLSQDELKNSLSKGPTLRRVRTLRNTAESAPTLASLVLPTSSRPGFLPRSLPDRH